MHYNNIFFTYIDNLNQDNINRLNKNVYIIVRNYEKKFENDELEYFVKFCKKIKKKVYLSNDIKRAKKLDFDGVYIPSFNKLPIKYNLGIKKKFTILGSAHNNKEILIKKNQKIDIIFVSPLFKNNKKKKYLGVIKFNLIVKNYNGKFIALGGINNKNLSKLKMLKISGFAGIDYFKTKNK
tara:strand:+ start:2733 stop:3275 length:543 start_codon:yes stop_codon:yes gene_type:complete